jgi:peptide/nickel transport system permease protein
MKKKRRRSFAKSRVAVFAVCVLAVFSLAAIFAPWISPHKPNQTNAAMQLRTSAPGFVLGTDQLGRDLLSRLIYGARTIMQTCLLSGIGILCIGLPIGLISGYYGGFIDTLLMRIVDVVLVIPPFFLVLTLVTVFGSNRWVLVLAMAATLWPFVARLARAEMLAQKERDYAQAARAIGASNLRIIVRHLLPNCIHPVITGLALLMADIVLTEAALSYLGLGDPTVISWGGMLRDAQRYLRRAWYLAIYPGTLIALLILSFNFLAEGLTNILRKGR